MSKPAPPARRRVGTLGSARAKIAEPATATERLNTEAALHLVTAMAESGRDAALDLLLRRAERPPFDGWYGPTWITQRNDVLVTPRTRPHGPSRRPEASPSGPRGAKGRDGARRILVW